MAKGLKTIPVAKELGGGLNVLSEESQLAPNHFRELIDASLEDGRTLQFPPGCVRINKARITGGAAVRLLAEYNKADGTRIRYAKASQTLYTFDLSGTIAATALTSLTADAVPGWTVHNDLFILCDPSGNFIGNGTVFGALGASGPTAPTLALAAGSELEVGAYNFKISRYSTVLVEESALSAVASITTTGGNERVTLSNLPALDSIWDRIRVYRTLVGGTSYFLDAERSVATDYTTTVSDATLATQTPAPTTDTVRPPAAKFPVIHLNRLWLFGLDGDDDAGRMSEPGLPYRFPSSNRITFSVKDGDSVTGAWVRDGRLYVAKKSKIFQLLGDGADNFELQEVDPGRGLGAERTLVTIGGRELILDLENGPFAFPSAPGDQDKIGVHLLPEVRQWNASRAAKFVAGHEPMSRAWYISATTDTAMSANDAVFAYHYERGTWSKLRLSGVGAFGSFHDANERIRLFYGTDDGYIHRIDADGNALRANLGGANSGTVQSGTATTVTTEGSLATTSDGWEDEYLTVIFLDADGQVEAIERKKITSNTASVFTTAAWAARAPRLNDLWFAGAFFMDALTGKHDIGDREHLKHIPWWWLYFTPQDHASKLYAALIADDDDATDDAKLAGFSTVQKTSQQLPFVRGGGGRRPAQVAARIVAVGSNQPQRVVGWAVAARISGVA